MKVEQIRETLSWLVLERERLRGLGASRAELERNRLEIVLRQQQLSHALIERHWRDSLPAAA
jgi:hypothetical protein